MIDGSLFPSRTQKRSSLLVALSLLCAACLPVRSFIQPAEALENPPPMDSYAESLEQSAESPRISLQAASGRTIQFVTQNGRTVDGVPPQSADIPHLVLFRDGKLTDPSERKLSLHIQELDLPPQGLVAMLSLETQHKSPQPGGGPWRPITAWTHTFVITNTLGITQVAGAAISLNFEFSATIDTPGGSALTPTDYYRIILTFGEVGAPDSRTVVLDYAFLLESQWRVPLPAVAESVPGSAPHELEVYACDMFLPWIDRAETPLTRQRFLELLQDELIPRLVLSYQAESNAWGFSWHPEWVSLRLLDDPRHLSVALSDGKTWFHGMATLGGTAEVSMTLEGWIQNRSDTLLSSLLSIYYHELFHNLQSDLSLHHCGQKEARGKGLAWEYFTEGTAVLASSVGQTELEFGPVSSWRGYMENANQYLGGSQPGESLNLSLKSMEPRFAALYWRFLYERCGGMSQGYEDQAAGMRVIRRTLETLYSGQVVDINASDDLIGGIDDILDRALADSACPYHTYAESLVAYARSVYSLRLDGGRCIAPGDPASCQLYDPNHKYAAPPAAEITYAGSAMSYATADQPHPAGIPSSYGMDFIDIRLAPGTDQSSLQLEFSGVEGAARRFSLQILLLKEGEGGVPPRQVSGEAVYTGILENSTSREPLALTIPQIERSSFDRLGLIITRLDDQEAVDPVGAYTITLRP